MILLVNPHYVQDHWQRAFDCSRQYKFKTLPNPRWKAEADSDSIDEISHDGASDIPTHVVKYRDCQQLDPR